MKVGKPGCRGKHSDASMNDDVPPRGAIGSLGRGKRGYPISPHRNFDNSHTFGPFFLSLSHHQSTILMLDVSSDLRSVHTGCRVVIAKP